MPAGTDTTLTLQASCANFCSGFIIVADVEYHLNPMVVSFRHFCIASQELVLEPKISTTHSYIYLGSHNFLSLCFHHSLPPIALHPPRSPSEIAALTSIYGVPADDAPEPGAVTGGPQSRDHRVPLR